MARQGVHTTDLSRPRGLLRYYLDTNWIVLSTCTICLHPSAISSAERTIHSLTCCKQCNVPCHDRHLEVYTVVLILPLPIPAELKCLARQPNRFGGEAETPYADFANLVRLDWTEHLDHSVQLPRYCFLSIPYCNNARILIILVLVLLPMPGNPDAIRVPEYYPSGIYTTSLFVVTFSGVHRIPTYNSFLATVPTIHKQRYLRGLRPAQVQAREPQVSSLDRDTVRSRPDYQDRVSDPGRRNITCARPCDSFNHTGL